MDEKELDEIRERHGLSLEMGESPWSCGTYREDVGKLLAEVDRLRGGFWQALFLALFVSAVVFFLGFSWGYWWSENRKPEIRVKVSTGRNPYYRGK